MMKINLLFLTFSMISSVTLAMNQQEVAMLLAAMNIALEQAAPENNQNIYLQEYKQKKKQKKWEFEPKIEKRPMAKGKFKRK